MVKNIFWISFFLFGFFPNIFSQSFGGNKWAQQWQQIASEDVRVIFPTGFEKQASRVYSLLDYLNHNHRESIGLKTDNISLVLNNLTNISNGYVGLAPFRSEFFTTPPQNNFALGSLPWLDLLTIHEYRHVLQFSNGKHGLSKVLSVLFGQSAYAGAINLAVPDWYFEGDAVMAETAMTPQGRGRIPSFLRGYKAYEAEGRRFSYDKVRNGSFKDFIPDHYRLGYMMSKYGADQYGVSFWGEVLADASSFKRIFYPFSAAIKERSGLTTKGLYKKAFDHYQSKWSAKPKNLTAAVTSIEPKEKVFTNYRIPYYKEDQLYYIKGGLNEVSSVYVNNGDKDRKLFTLGLSNDIYIDINGGMISWSELRFHPSRGNIDYSVAMTYNLATGIKQQVSFQTRYASPTVHPDGKIMAVVDIDKFGNTQLKLITTRDGLVVDSLSNIDNYFITYPKWSEDANTIFFAARNAQGQMAICSQEVNTGKVAVISSWSFNPIGVPHVAEDYIYFSKSGEDAEHIYRVHKENGTEELIVKSEFGAYNPYVKGGDIIYSSYSSKGLRIVQSVIKPSAIKSSIEQLPLDKTYADYGGDILQTVPQTTTASTKKYGRLNRAINLHSWGITADDQTASVLIQSDNVLNSVSLSGGLQYIFDDDRAIWTAGASFGFIYPNLTTRYTLEARQVSVMVDDEPEIINFDDHSISIGLVAPLNLSSGAYTRFLRPSFEIERRLFRGPRIEDLNFTSQRIGLLMLNRRLKSPQEILAKNSQYINLSYQGTIDNREGSQFDLESEITIPGLVNPHVIRLELDYNKQSEGLFSSRFDQARGYSQLNAEQSFRLGINYHLPLLYPDFGIAGIAYLKRIQANLFYDYSNLSAGDNSINLSSAGVEFLFDTNLLNTLPVTFGLRYARAIELNDNVFEFFIPFYRF